VLLQNYVLCLATLLFKGLTSRLVFKVFKTMDVFVCLQTSMAQALEKE
jgi:hypothetical protein